MAMIQLPSLQPANKWLKFTPPHNIKISICWCLNFCILMYYLNAPFRQHQTQALEDGSKLFGFCISFISRFSWEHLVLSQSVQNARLADLPLLHCRKYITAFSASEYQTFYSTNELLLVSFLSKYLTTTGCFSISANTIWNGAGFKQASKIALHVQLFY